MKGYKTSKKHKKLWKLIKAGYKVPAWIEHKGQTLLTQVEKAQGRIRVDHESDEWYESNFKKDFLKFCKNYNLRYLPPNEE